LIRWIAVVLLTAEENAFMPEITLDVYKAMVGQEVGVSRWFEVAQDRIDTFAM
jgi:hypothetical protein